MANAIKPGRAEAHNFDLNALPDGYFDDPFPIYHALRTHDPVHLCPDDSYLLTRYADLAAVYRDKRFSSNKEDLFGPKFGDTPLYRHHTTSLVFSDPPYHDRVRRLIAGALKPKTVKAMAPGLHKLVESLLDRLEEKQKFDLIADFATAIPIEIIGNLLRIPHDERAPLRGWSLAILGALEPTLSKDQHARGNRAVEEFCEFLTRLVEERRRHLSDDETDVLSCLIKGEGGERLSEQELFQNCIFLLNAGHETTTNLIGNGVHELLIHPHALEQLRKEPGLIKDAVEEILRYQSSNQLGNRQVTVDVTVGDVHMPAGTQVTLGIGAANRDPSQFERPDEFDIKRHPNSHLAFATGIHACIGMSLARLEGQIAISRLIDRFPNLRLDGEAVRQRRARFRGFGSLPMAVV